MLTYILQDAHGQILPTYSISAGLDYPGVGPEHSYLHSLQRVQYVAATDGEALAAFQELSKMEGIIPALESCHALAHLKKIAPTMSSEQIAVVTISGRGDKDVEVVAKLLEEQT
jgi:tryptophan synthase beta chain